MYGSHLSCHRVMLCFAGALALASTAMANPLEWGSVEGVIDASSLHHAGEEGRAWVYVYLYNPIAIHDAHPQGVHGVREKYERDFQVLNDMKFDAWRERVRQGGIAKDDVPKFPGPSISFLNGKSTSSNHAFIREGEYLPVLNLSQDVHSLNLAGGANYDRASVLRPGHADNMSLGSILDVPFAASCDVHQGERFILQVLPHPYFVKVDSSGHFALKNVPAGGNRLAISTARGCYALDGSPGSCRGTEVQVPPNGTLQLEKIKLREPSRKP